MGSYWLPVDTYGLLHLLQFWGLFMWLQKRFRSDTMANTALEAIASWSSKNRIILSSTSKLALWIPNIHFRFGARNLLSRSDLLVGTVNGLV